MRPVPLVSIGLPIYNGRLTAERVVKSVLAQDHLDLELVISDNASTDGTEEICRTLAAADDRVVYLRRPENIGLVPNFMGTLRAAQGKYFRWIGDGDGIDPAYVSRCLSVFAQDERLVLVSTQLDYELADGTTTTTAYSGTALRSPDPAVRFGEMLRLLTEGYAELDPLYSMMRREAVAGLSFPRILRGDEVFAARMALAGPWAHVPEVLAGRGWTNDTLASIAPRLGVPRWQAPFAAEIQCRELLRAVAEADLTPEQARHARAEVGKLYATRIRRAAERGLRKIGRGLGELRHTAGRRNGEPPLREPVRGNPVPARPNRQSTSGDGA